MSVPEKHLSDPGSYYRDQAKHARNKVAAATPDSDMSRSWLNIAEEYDTLAQITDETKEIVGATETAR
jgi:hypothetical protein